MISLRRRRDRCSVALLTVLLTAAAVAQLAYAGPDDEAAAKKKLKPPAHWDFPARPPLHVLQVRGLWFSHYAVDRALARLGGARLTDSWHSLGAYWGSCRPSRNWPTGLVDYPGNYQGLMRHHLVIVCNIDGRAFGPVRRKMLKDYVAAGGGVLLLGGKFAFGARYHGTALEELAPVVFADGDDLRHGKEGLVLARGQDKVGDGFDGLSWDQRPRVYWYHAVTPKDGSKILLTASGKPLCIAGTFGKGRAVVFAGSVMGEPQADQLPFWQWEQWPDVLGQIITWLAEPTVNLAEREGEDLREELLAEIMASADKEHAARLRVLSKYAPKCSSVEMAELLLSAAQCDEDLPPEAGRRLCAGVRPFVTRRSAEAAGKLIASGHPHQVALGLRVLGLSRTEDARAVLTKALARGDVAQAPAAVAEDDLLKVPEPTTQDPAERARTIRLAAVKGLGDLADPKAASLLRRLAQKERKGPLYEEAIVAGLKCGDPESATELVDLYLEKVYESIRLRSTIDTPDYGLPQLVQAKKRARQALPAVLARQGYLIESGSCRSEAVLAALAKRIAAEDDPHVLPIAFAVFGAAPNARERPIPEDVANLLRGSRIVAVADLAHQPKERAP